jgi:hypothetical protein
VLQPADVLILHAGADPTNSFILQFRLQTNTDGPLAGKTLAVKDLFDVSATSQHQCDPLGASAASRVLQQLEAAAALLRSCHSWF